MPSVRWAWIGRLEVGAGLKRTGEEEEDDGITTEASLQDKEIRMLSAQGRTREDKIIR